MSFYLLNTLLSQSENWACLVEHNADVLVWIEEKHSF